MNSKKTVYLFRGEPGSGKTSTAEELVSKDFLVAADDYPGFWETGEYKYRLDLQKDSHDWCFDRYKGFLKAGAEKIGVHNTFMQLGFMSPYIQLAIAHDYAVKIIYCECVIVPPNGGFAESIHSVPTETVDRMRDSFEPIRRAKSGMDFIDLAQQFKKLQVPDAVLVDWDGTLTRTKTGGNFAQFPSDIFLSSAIGSLNDLQFLLMEEVNISSLQVHIISNQRGLQTGNKDLKFLEEQYKEFLTLVEQRTGGNLEIASARFAASPETYLLCDDENYFTQIKPLHRADKPGIGMVENLLPKDSLSNIWIIGDSHVQGRRDDWELYKNCAEAFLFNQFQYIPVEMLDVAIDVLGLSL